MIAAAAIMHISWAIAKHSGKADHFSHETGPGEHGWVNFWERHPKLTLRNADKLECSFAEALNPEMVKEYMYFDLLKEMLDWNALTNSLCQLCNCDDTFLPLDYTPEKAVTVKNPSMCMLSPREPLTTVYITVLCTASVAGFHSPLYHLHTTNVFPGSQHKLDGREDAFYGKSESGWIDLELFVAWLRKIFLK